MEVGDSHRSRSQRFNHFTELTILIVQLVVEFTKQLPGFLDVSREDQVNPVFKTFRTRLASY